MVCITVHNMEASIPGHNVHTFLLIRILTAKHSECRVYVNDLGKLEATTENILGYLCDHNKLILDQIVKDEGFCLGSDIHITRAKPNYYFNHRGIGYEIE